MNGLVAVLLGVALLCWPSSPSARAVRAILRDQGAGGREQASRWRHGVRRVTGSAGWRSRRGVGVGEEWLPVLDQLAASLRAGLPPAEALALVLETSRGAVRTALEVVCESARAGRPCAPSWLRVARSHDPVAPGSQGGELELLARSWAISEQLGAPLADAVDSVAWAVRSRRELASKLDTATAGARTTATILTLLPVAGVGVALTMGIAPTELYGSPVALVSLTAGLVLIGLGRVVVAGMVRRATDVS